MTLKINNAAGGGSSAPYYNTPTDFPGYIPGNYYIPSVQAGAFNLFPLSPDIIYFAPFATKGAFTAAKIGLLNSSAAQSGNKFRLGIYNDDGGGSPDVLLLDSGEITLSGAIAFRENAIAQALAENTLYWLALIMDISTTFECLDSTGGTGALYFPPIMYDYGTQGFKLGAINGANRTMEASPQAYGALPATVTTDGAALQRSATPIPNILIGA